MKQPPHIEYGTPEFCALRPKIDALIEKRKAAAQQVAECVKRHIREEIELAESCSCVSEYFEKLLALELQQDKELEPLQANFRALQVEITELAASVWVSNRQQTAELLNIKTRIL